MMGKKLTQNNKKTLASIGLILTTIIWGSSFVVMKNSVDIITPIYIMAIRFTIGGIVMMIFFAQKLKTIKKTDLWPGLVLGFFLFISYAFQTYGLKHTTASNNAFITTLYVIIVPFLNLLFNKVRISKNCIIAAILATIGIGLLSLNGGITMIRIGDVLTLICSFCYAVHIIFIDRFAKKHDPIVLTLLQLIVAAGFCWVLAPMLEGKLLLEVFTPSLIGTLMYLGIFATMIGFLLQNLGQKYVRPATTCILMSLECVFGAVFAIIFLGDPLTIKILLGCVLIFGAVILSEIRL